MKGWTAADFLLLFGIRSLAGFRLENVLIPQAKAMTTFKNDPPYFF